MTEMDTHALMAATAAMAVLMTLAAWFDLKWLRIPNWCVLAVVAVFIVTGLWGLPLDTFGQRSHRLQGQTAQARVVRGQPGQAAALDRAVGKRRPVELRGSGFGRQDSSSIRIA